MLRCAKMAVTPYLWAGVAALSLVGCGRADAPEPDMPAATAEVAEPGDEAPAEAPEPTRVTPDRPPPPERLADPVPFEQLMAVLVEVDGWTRTDHRGREVSQPVRQSAAEARYEREGVLVHVTAVDTARSRILLAPYAMFLASGFEERSSDGLKRAFTFDGSPAFENWHNASGTVDVVVRINDRFIVRGSATGVSSRDPVTRLLRGLDVTPLRGLR